MASATPHRAASTYTTATLFVKNLHQEEGNIVNISRDEKYVRRNGDVLLVEVRDLKVGEGGTVFTIDLNLLS
jgi:hypothetical protein